MSTPNKVFSTMKFKLRAVLVLVTLVTLLSTGFIMFMFYKTKILISIPFGMEVSAFVYGESPVDAPAPCFTNMSMSSNSNNEILLAVIDSGYLDMAENFFITSIDRWNIANHLFISSDKAACDTLMMRHPKLSCTVCLSSLQELDHSSNYRSPEFINKMHYRTYLILEILQLGYNILHSDTDVIFLKNPFDHILLPRDCDMAYLLDSTNINAGFLFLRPSNVIKQVFRDMIQMMKKVRSLDDQVALNKVVNNYSKSICRVQLPVNKFSSGKLFWEYKKREFSQDSVCTDCVVVHDNFIVSKEAKRYRLKESGLWQVDTAAYYSSLQRKYIISVPLTNVDQVNDNEGIEALITLLYFGKLLNRTVILPKFICYEGKQKKLCNILHKLQYSKLEDTFPAHRENSFLEHFLVPGEVKRSLSPIFCLQKRNLPKHRRECDRIFAPRDVLEGATADEIKQWFKESSFSVLRFSQLETNILEKHDKNWLDFQKQLEQGFDQINNYRQA